MLNVVCASCNPPAIFQAAQCAEERFIEAFIHCPAGFCEANAERGAACR